jgi:hypothetical protein
MTREEAIEALKYSIGVFPVTDRAVSALDMAVKALEQEPCGDCISRQAAIDAFGLSEKTRKYGGDHSGYDTMMLYEIQQTLEDLPSVNPQEPKTGHCKDCKYFEYDSWAKVNGIPLIVAHEICKRWGDGCKTWEDGYCFLFEPQESEEQA